MTKICCSFLAALMGLAITPAAVAQGILTGDTRLACEAILCLSSATQPAECQPSLQRYYSIVRRRLRDTIQARNDFLSQCPKVNANAQSGAVIKEFVVAANGCDAASLNKTLLVYSDADGVYYIDNRLPSACVTYVSNAKVPAYVGVAKQGGKWIDQ